MSVNTEELLVIDVLDEDAGLADVEDTRGRTFQLPAEWLPVTFTPDPDGARLLRERSKQTLLDFTDENSPGEEQGEPL